MAKYSDEIKEEVAKLLNAGLSLSFVSAKYPNIPLSSLRNFPREMQRKQKERELYESVASPKAGLFCAAREYVAKSPIIEPRSISEVDLNSGNNTVMYSPDKHAPFMHQDAFEFCKAVDARFKPNIHIDAGDEVDFHAMSRFPTDPNGYSPGHELSKAIEQLIPFYRHFPNMMVCESNHTVRGHKKAFEAGLPAAFMAHISKVLNAPDGWRWGPRWVVDNVIYKHGMGRSGKNGHRQHAEQAGKSVAVGHLHANAGVSYIAPEWFAVNAGCLIDADAYAFAYHRDIEPNIVLGCTIVYGGQEAHFIPMHLDKHKRWTGKIWL